MKKRISTFLLALLAALTLTVPAWAETQPGDALIYDTESLLTDGERQQLESLADQITWQYDCAVYVVTIYDYEQYADGVYEAACTIYNDYDFGIGEDRDGVLLLLSMYDRSYDLYVRDGGIAQYAVSDYGRHKMTDVFLDNFGEDDWRGGFEDYLFACDEYLTLAEQGTPVKKSLTSSLLPGLAIEDGFVKVDRHMATNIEGAFAAGDIAGAPLQVAKAVGEGLIAGLSAAEYLDKL